ncbi:putative C2H2 transcription factor [Rosellinia necatrix]|uniref:Putative C2H2 transcription factor n=1 Tax=Rosellinia necatrix TaxID=77044 RepID=A0A1S7UPZ2_ROSNE|nr:putative C2H2 transcription factor [Rosellinia necatrix]
MESQGLWDRLFAGGSATTTSASTTATSTPSAPSTQPGRSTHWPESNPSSPFSSRRGTNQATKAVSKSKSQAPETTGQNNLPNHHTIHNNNISRPSSTTSLSASRPAAAVVGVAVASTAVPTPASSHSLSSPSPSPQPTTPVDPIGLTDRIDNSSLFPSSKAIRIPGPPNACSPNSASVDPAHQSELDFLCPDNDDDAWFADCINVDMTTGPALDSAVGRSRQDSFVSTGAKPISMINPNRDHANRGRRESLAGSLMNGMSWGGLSVGSFIRDDLAMTGTSPFAGAAQSPSFHSNSYIPKMEAEYLRDFVCCDLKLETMHDLLRHYETVHTGANSQGNRNGNGVRMPHRLSVSSRPSIPMGSSRPDVQGFQNQGQMSFGQQNRIGGSNGVSSMGFSNLHGVRQSMGMDSGKQAHLGSMQSNDEMDTVGDMEMDDAVGMMEMDDSSHRTIQQTRQMFGQQRPQLQLNSSGLPQALRTSQPPTPGASGFGYQNNPTVSSVNTPTLTTNQSGMGGGVPDSLIDGSSLDFMDLNSAVGNLNTSTLSEYFIQDPAKRLYSPNGTANQQRVLQQQMAQFGLDQNQFPNINDPTHLAALQRAIANPETFTMPPEEDKPFKCPVIGCEKAYKNQNGLKYHKQHGHQNQQLHENGDGTFSIVNPETSAPYPGETGMEKEKPHKCEYCHKRYKNLNGLKYHKQHSSACEIQAQAASIRANLSNNQMAFNMNLTHGLPGIGEEMQM